MKQKIRLMAMLWPILTIMCLEARAQQPEPLAVTGKVVSAASGAAIEGATITNKRTSIHAVTDRLGEYRITGTVIAAKDGKPLGGATVSIRGGAKVQTDAAGFFTLPVNQREGAIVVSFVGYKVAEEPYVVGRKPLLVALEADESVLSEVEVNAGYYTVKDRERTGSIARITSETIGKQPVTNVLSAMQGRMAGVEITQHTGIPGGDFTIRIRGANSLRNEGNEPLFLVDGVPLIDNTSNIEAGQIVIGSGNLLNVINPADVERIEVLKDADATAIYGSRGANGVVLITTKKARAGKTSLDVRLGAGVSTVPRFLELLNTRQYLEMRREAFANDGTNPTNNNAYDLLMWDTTRYTDWQGELLGDVARNTNAQLSLTGGNRNTRFVIRGGYQRNGNVYPGSGAYTNASGHLNVVHNTTDDRLQIGATITYGIRGQNQPQIDLVRLARTLPPIAPPAYKADGSLNWGPSVPSRFDNPMAYLGKTYESNTNSLATHSALKYRLWSALSFNINGGYNRVFLDEALASPARSNSINPQTGEPYLSSMRNSDRTTESWILEPQLDYSERFGQHAINALVGTTFQHSGQFGKDITGVDYLDEAMIRDLASAQRYIARSIFAAYRYAALFGRINYNYRQTYIVNLTLRRDGSSRFGSGKKWGTFGAVGAAWLFSEEATLEGLTWLSLGKLRASYGVTGSDQIGDYGYLASYRSSTASPYQIPSLLPARIANPDYHWETNRKLELALEVGLWSDRLNIVSAWYRNRSGNQLIGLPLPYTAGFPTVQSNFPATIQNSGFEGEINSTVIKNRDFSWRVGFNFNINNRKLLSFPELETFSSYRNSYVVGEPTALVRRYRYLGVDPVTGLYAVADMSDDKIYNLDGDSYWYRPRRPYGFGISNGLAIRGVEMSFFLRYARQEVADPLQSFAMPGTISNQPVAVMQRWQHAGDSPSVQRFSVSQGNAFRSRYALSDANAIDGSYLRLQNVAISWSLPMQIARRLHIGQLQFYLLGQNLLVWSTGSTQYDPETSPFSLPPLRTFQAGFKITI